jgi:hypothetical protein
MIATWGAGHSGQCHLVFPQPNTCINRGAGLQACGGRPRPPVPLREERVLEDPRTVENPAQPVGEPAGLETRRRRRRPPHVVFITIRGP